MAMESVKKTLLNLFLASAGFLAGKLMGSSSKVHSALENLGKYFSGASETQADVVEPEAKTEEKDDSSIKSLKDYYQRKEGFRQ